MASAQSKLASAVHRTVLGMLGAAVGLVGVALLSADDPLVAVGGLVLVGGAVLLVALLVRDGLREGRETG